MKGRRPLTPIEVNKTLTAFRGKMATRNSALFLLGINTGFRISELLSLTIGDFLEVSGAPKTRLMVQRRNMKGKKTSRTIKLNSSAIAWVTPWLIELKNKGHIHRDDVLFPASRPGNKAIGRHAVGKLLKVAFDAAALTGPLGTHSMRKTFALNTYQYYLSRVAQGEAIDALRLTSKALGHTDIKNTDKYLSFLNSDIDAAIDAIGVYYVRQ